MNAPASPPPDNRAMTARRTIIVLVVLLAFGLGLVLIYEIRSVIAWLLVASLLAVALHPIVEFLARHRWRRGLAAVFVSFIFLVIIIGVVAALATPLVTQAKELVINLPEYVRDLFRPGSPLAPLDERFNIVERLQQVDIGTVWNFIAGGGATVFSALSKGFYWMFAAITTFTLMIMLLVEGPRVWNGFAGLFSEERREWIDGLGDRLSRAVGGYVRGNLLISVIAAALAYIVLVILDVPYPVPLALTVGVLDIIPLVGATIGAAVCVGVALTQGWVIAVILLGYFIVYQQIENNFIQPMVYSRTAKLTPLTVLVVSLIGAILAGILGVLVAIPLASAGMILLQEYRARRTSAPQVLQPLDQLEASAPAVAQGGSLLADEDRPEEGQPPSETEPRPEERPQRILEVDEANNEREGER